MMGLFMEEIALDVPVALGSYNFTRENMLAYSRKFDPVGFHVDDEAGRLSPFRAITAAGLHVACGWMVCFVETNTRARDALVAAGKELPEIGPSPGIKTMRWLKPVYAGDVIAFSTMARAKRALASRPGWGMVSGYNEGVNQQGEVVFSFESAVLTAVKSR
jgi:acyl dehydratase